MPAGVSRQAAEAVLTLKSKNELGKDFAGLAKQLDATTAALKRLEVQSDRIEQAFGRLGQAGRRTGDLTSRQEKELLKTMQKRLDLMDAEIRKTNQLAQARDRLNRLGAGGGGGGGGGGGLGGMLGRIFGGGGGGGGGGRGGRIYDPTDPEGLARMVGFGAKAYMVNYLTGDPIGKFINPYLGAMGRSQEVSGFFTTVEGLRRRNYNGVGSFQQGYSMQGQGAERSFRQDLMRQGSQYGYSPAETAGLAAALQSMQGSSRISLAGLTGSVMQGARQSGIDATDLGALTSAQYRMGGTNSTSSLLGVGYSMSMANNGQMAGREKELIEALTQLQQAVTDQTHEYTETNAFSGQLAALGASGNRALMGSQGAALISRMSGAEGALGDNFRQMTEFTVAQGAAKDMGMGGLSYAQFRYEKERGGSSTLNQETQRRIYQQILGMAGGDTKLADMLYADRMGLSMHDVEASRLNGQAIGQTSMSGVQAMMAGANGGTAPSITGTGPESVAYGNNEAWSKFDEATQETAQNVAHLGTYAVMAATAFQNFMNSMPGHPGYTDPGGGYSGGWGGDPGQTGNSPLSALWGMIFPKHHSGTSGAASGVALLQGGEYVGDRAETSSYSPYRFAEILATEIARRLSQTELKLSSLQLKDDMGRVLGLGGGGGIGPSPFSPITITGSGAPGDTVTGGTSSVGAGTSGWNPANVRTVGGGLIPNQGTDYTDPQFGGAPAGLTPYQMEYICGPIVMEALLQHDGRTTSLATVATKAAQEGLWTTAGMNQGDMQKMAAEYGIDLESTDPASAKKAIQSGGMGVLNIPANSTGTWGGHWMLAQGYDAQTDKYFWGNSAASALRGGKPWMSLDELAGLTGMPVSSFGWQTAYDRGSNPGGAPPGGGMPGGGGAESETDAIKRIAAKYGVDPAIALKVFTAESAGNLSNWAVPGDYGSASGKPTSFGPAQLHVGGLDPGGIQNGAGLGDAFMQQTGLDPSDPKNGPAALDWALKQVAQGGAGWQPWHAAAAIGVSQFEGVGSGKGGGSQAAAVLTAMAGSTVQVSFAPLVIQVANGDGSTTTHILNPVVNTQDPYRGLLAGAYS